MFGPPRPEWLALHTEPIIDPDRPIVDSHQHLWDHPGNRYMAEDFAADLATGHNIVASVYMECASHYRETGPEALRPVGEVELAASLAARVGNTDICAAIVGTADLSFGDGVKPVLEAAIEAGQGRLRGIRRITAWDADEEMMANLIRRRPGMLAEPAFRQGLACLAPLGLSYDAFVFQPQLPELIEIVHAFPDMQIVIDHCGGPIRIASYGRRIEESFAAWRADLRALARCDNVWIKLGGLGMRIAGFDFEWRDTPPTSEQLAEAWRPIIETCIEAFGPSRSMFESNFPPDKGVTTYPILWNAFKRITAGYSEEEKDALFSGSASRFYRLLSPPRRGR